MVMCRACLAAETNMIAMDVSVLNNFNLLTGLNITMMDNYYICKSCSVAVKFFMGFREKCIESDLSFREILVQDIKQEIDVFDEEDINIKDELKSEFDNSDRFDHTQNDDSGLHSNTEIKNLKPTKVVDTKRRNNSNEAKNKVKRKELINQDDNINNTKECNINSRLQCGLCEKCLDTNAQLSTHLSEHTATTCGLCPERFSNLPHMLAHRIEHLPAGQRLCHVCSRKFAGSTAINLEFHYMRVHEMAEKDAKIDCKQCKSSYINANKLVRHVRDCHSAFRYGCQFCAKGFRNKTGLKIHSAQHKQEKNIKCELCNFTSKYASSLLLHKRRKHSDIKASCKQCGRVFADETALQRHVGRVCTGGASVVCTVCGNTVKKDWVSRHMRSHSEVYRYKCGVCPARYKYRTGYRDHVEKHAGRMRHRCDVCPKAFSVRGSLVAHRRTHTGEKPYQCEICSMAFAKRYNLKMHMSVHGPTYNETSQ